MSSREIEVTCPCCSARLQVDIRTAQVMKSVRKEDSEGSAASSDKWSAAQGKVEERTRGGLDKLERALEHERGKKDRFDQLFKEATEKHKGEQDS